MARVAAAVAVVFAVGAGAMAMLGGVIGSAAEAASLGIVGAGLVGTSYLLGGRMGARRNVGAAASQMSETRAA